VSRRGDGSRRKDILAAALDAFLVHGVAGTTTEELRERSGASIGSIYHWFGSKMGVAAELYVSALETVQFLLLDELISGPSARLGLENSISSFAEWVYEHQALASFYLHCREPEVVEATEARVAALSEEFYSGLLSWLERQTMAGEVRGVDRLVFGALWMGSMQELGRAWLNSAERDPQRLRLAAQELALAIADSLCSTGSL
jgi:AcrR family transcriptional regulator